MEDHEHIEDRVRVVCEPEEPEEVPPCKIRESVYDGSVDGKQDAREARDGLQAPIVELG